MNISCSGIVACPNDASPAFDMKSREYFGASAATAQSPGPITNEILRRNDFAGYEIFTQVSYQYGGLISPAHEKSTLSILRSGSARAIGGPLEARRGRPAENKYVRRVEVS